MADFVFPESTGRLPSPKQPLSLKKLIAIIYVFGGVSAAIALLSKFVVMPLFEQLTLDRSVYAQEARRKLFDFNLRLTALVSRVPSSRAITQGYTDAQTQTVAKDWSLKPSKAISEEQDWDQFRNMFIDANNTFDLDTEKRTADRIEELNRYLRTLMYGQYNKQYSSITGAPTNKNDITSEVKKEIRSLKGAVLSL